MTEMELRDRTNSFAESVAMVCRGLPELRESRVIANQMIRSATSVAANYREACRARTQAEFVSKLSIVESDADEAQLWLELAKELGLAKSGTVDLLIKGSDV